jgi:transcriptional regulator with XRE-family HTH domain
VIVTEIVEVGATEDPQRAVKGEQALASTKPPETADPDDEADREEIRAIGAVIRSLRQERGLSLRDVADRTGFSVSFLSLVERGRSSLALTSVYKLARAFGVDVTTFFETTPDPDPLPHVTRAGEGDELVIAGSDHKYRLLTGRTADRELEPLMVVISPTDAAVEPVTHDGDEFVYVLVGAISFFVGDGRYDLRTGDSIHFRANVPHSHLVDPKHGPVTALWVLSAPLTSPVRRP